MADVSGFSRHVRPGNDGEFFSIGAKIGVIRDESGTFAELIQHGVTTVDDVEDIGIINLWAAVVVEACGLGKGTENIEDSQRVGCFLQAGEFGKDGGAEFGKDLNLAGAGTFFGTEDLSFDFFELGCDEALAPDRGLFANVVLRNRS